MSLETFFPFKEVNRAAQAAQWETNWAVPVHHWCVKRTVMKTHHGKLVVDATVISWGELWLLISWRTLSKPFIRTVATASKPLTSSANLAHKFSKNNPKIHYAIPCEAEIVSTPNVLITHEHSIAVPPKTWTIRSFIQCDERITNKKLFPLPINEKLSAYVFLIKSGESHKSDEDFHQQCHWMGKALIICFWRSENECKSFNRNS